MAQQKLYSGTNSNEEIYVEVDGHKVVYLMRHWTTHPGEAMDFAHVSARRHGGEMVVLFLPKWDNARFKRTEGKFGYAVNRSESSEWYDITREGAERGHDFESTEQKSIRAYTQNDLEKFINEHCRKKEDERRWLNAYLSDLQRSQDQK